MSDHRSTDPPIPVPSAEPASVGPSRRSSCPLGPAPAPAHGYLNSRSPLPGQRHTEIGAFRRFGAGAFRGPDRCLDPRSALGGGRPIALCRPPGGIWTVCRGGRPNDLRGRPMPVTRWFPVGGARATKLVPRECDLRWFWFLVLFKLAYGSPRNACAQLRQKR